MKQLLAIILSVIYMLPALGVYYTLPTDSLTEDGYTLDFEDESGQEYLDSLIDKIRGSVREVTYPDSTIERLKSMPGATALSYTHEENTYVPTSVSVDTSREVGEIHISSGISQAGAKTYDVPVNMPAGIRGFQPQLSISYDSHRGNSYLGKGWHLAGLSAISRSGKTFYYDSGTVASVEMDADDAFVIDGNRLIQTGCLSGCRLYQTEFGDIKAKAYIDGDVVRYFEVFYPNGNKGVFGFTDSEVNWPVYPISTLTDLYGNRIEYTYNLTDNIYHISTISYSGYAVEFTYAQDRKDPIFAYAASVRMEENSLMRSIACKSGSTEIWYYTFNYEYQTDTNGQHCNALLSEINYSAGGATPNPLRFYYGTGADSDTFTTSRTILASYYSTDDPDKIKLVKGRFEYGSTDDGLIVLPNYNPYFKYSGDAGNDYYRNCYSGTEKIFLYTRLGDDVALPMPDLETGEGFVDILCADIRGLCGDYVVKVNECVENKRDILTFTVYGPTMLGGLGKVYTRTYDMGYAYADNNKHWSIWPRFFFAGDYDGDGKAEIMAISTAGAFLTANHASLCTVFDIDGDTKLYEGNMLNYRVEFTGDKQTDPIEAVNNSDRLFILDYDGDGKTDICHIADTGVFIYTFDVAEGGLTPRLLASDNTLTKSSVRDREVICGEFNGDGLMDIVVSPSNKTGSSDWLIHYSRGRDGFAKYSFKGVTRKANGKEGYYVQDIDGDGKTELVMYDKSGFNAFLTRENIPSTAVSASYEENTRMVPSNINSATGACQLISLCNGMATMYSFSGSTNMESLLTGVVNSHGIVERNDYAMLNDPGAKNETYIKGDGAAFPYVNITEAIPVLASSETFMNGGSIGRWDYRYTDAVLHRQGKGFCGFSRIEATDAFDMMQIREYAPSLYGMMISERTPGHEIYCEYEDLTGSDRIMRVNLTSKTEKDLLKGVSSTTSYKSHDSFGYPLLEECVYSDGSTVRNQYAYASSSGVKDGYNLGFLRERTTTITRNGKTYIEHINIPAYDKRLPKVKVLYKDNNQVKQVTTMFDSHGNPKSETVKHYSSPNSHATQYTYDSSGRIASATYPTGLSESFSYDSRGLLASMRDIRGEKTTFGYDGFGRQTSVSYPDSTCRTVEYSWASANGSLYSITTRQTGRPDSTIYYDALNREVRCVEKRMDGSLKIIDRLYDGRGNLLKVSLPFKKGEPYAWDIFEYDDHDRLVRCAEANGKTTTYTYNGNSKTENNGRTSTTRKYDVLGNLISVTDQSGTVTYEYAPDGQMSKIIAPGNIVTTMEYDKYRRQISMTDPSLGQVTCTYDASGNIASQTDAEGRTVSYGYDSYNRLTKKMCDELTSTYEYDSYGRLKSVSSDNGSGTEYAYDSHGRVKEVREDGLDDVWLKTDYLYKSGDISATSYTSAKGKLATETYTYANGHLREVILNNETAIYRRNGENSYGQPTWIQTGPVTRMYAHTGFALPHNRMAYTESDTLQNMGYVFDSKTGNMLSRTDNMRNIKESFTYDSENRLTKFGNFTVSYDSKGNILDKGDVGSLSYDIPGKPYAVSGLTPTGDIIPSGLQEISYTSFSRPSSMTGGEYSAEFEYNSEGERVRMKILRSGNNTLPLTRHYLGDRYECETNGIRLSERLYLGGDAYSAPALIERTSLLQIADTTKLGPIGPLEPFQPANADISGADVNASSSGPEIASIFGTRIYYLLRDCLGSVTHVVSSQGEVVQELSYDAWGRFRDPDTQVVFPPDGQPTPKFGRGHTGHEHLPWFGLVNMNARLYDPLLGRFLSPDPNVQAPFWLQNLNRYTYAMNNPLCYIDEDGEFFQYILAAALFGGAINVINHWDEITAAGGWNSLWKGAGYFLVGGAAAGIGAAAGLGAVIGVGSMLGTTALTLSSTTASILTGAIYNGTRGFTEGLVLRTSNSMMQGVSFNNAISNAIEDAAMDGLTGAVTGAVNSGVGAVSKGRLLQDCPTERGFYGYFGYDDKGFVRYVGITRRPPQKRFYEHLNSKSPRRYLDFKAKFEFDNELDLLIWEQNNINFFKMQKDGGLLLNLRNSISPKRWDELGIKP